MRHISNLAAKKEKEEEAFPWCLFSSAAGKEEVEQTLAGRQNTVCGVQSVQSQILMVSQGRWSTRDIKQLKSILTEALKNRTSDQLLRGGTGDWLSKKSNIIVALWQTHQWLFVNYFANPSCQASSYSLVAERIESEPNIILGGSTRNHLRFRFGDKWEKRLFISKQKEVNVAAAETSYIS